MPCKLYGGRPLIWLMIHYCHIIICPYPDIVIRKSHGCAAAAGPAGGAAGAARGRLPAGRRGAGAAAA